jgi:hypothetical protein
LFFYVSIFRGRDIFFLMEYVLKSVFDLSLEIKHGQLVILQGSLLHNSYSCTVDANEDCKGSLVTVEFRVSKSFESRKSKCLETKSMHYTSKVYTDAEFATDVTIDALMKELRPTATFDCQSSTDYLDPCVWNIPQICSKTSSDDDSLLCALPFTPCLLSMQQQLQNINPTWFDWCRVTYFPSMDGEVQERIANQSEIATDCDRASFYFFEDSEASLLLQVKAKHTYKQFTWPSAFSANFLDVEEVLEDELPEKRKPKRKCATENKPKRDGKFASKHFKHWWGGGN